MSLEYSIYDKSRDKLFISIPYLFNLLEKSNFSIFTSSVLSLGWTDRHLRRKNSRYDITTSQISLLTIQLSSFLQLVPIPTIFSRNLWRLSIPTNHDEISPFGVSSRNLQDVPFVTWFTSHLLRSSSPTFPYRSFIIIKSVITIINYWNIE